MNYSEHCYSLFIQSNSLLNISYIYYELRSHIDKVLLLIKYSLDYDYTQVWICKNEFRFHKSWPKRETTDHHNPRRKKKAKKSHNVNKFPNKIAIMHKKKLWMIWNDQNYLYLKLQLLKSVQRFISSYWIEQIWYSQSYLQLKF